MDQDWVHVWYFLYMLKLIKADDQIRVRINVITLILILLWHFVTTERRNLILAWLHHLSHMTSSCPAEVPIAQLYHRFSIARSWKQCLTTYKPISIISYFNDLLWPVFVSAKLKGCKMFSPLPRSVLIVNIKKSQVKGEFFLYLLVVTRFGNSVMKNAVHNVWYDIITL